MCEHIACDDRACAHHRPFAKGCAADDGCVRADRRSTLDVGSNDLPLADGPRVSIVGEHTRWAEKDIIGNGDPVIDADVVLDFDATADDGIAVDVDVLTQRAVIADCGAGANMRVVPNCCAVTDSPPNRCSSNLNKSGRRCSARSILSTRRA